MSLLLVENTMTCVLSLELYFPFMFPFAYAVLAYISLNDCFLFFVASIHMAVTAAKRLGFDPSLVKSVMSLMNSKNSSVEIAWGASHLGRKVCSSLG